MYENAVDADLAAIAALMNRAYRGTGWTSEGDLIAGDRTTAAFLREEMVERPEGQLLKWVAPGDATPLGCVWLEPTGDGGWYLGSFAADPDRQQAGLGRTMLAAAEQWVRARGGTRVRMTVIHLRAELIAWYERRGYRRTGAIEPFPYDNHRLGTPRRDDLAFVVLEKALATDMH
ncbi:acetyltransferase [alpha proteobacterium AAP81b]|nr:acetyltransferase [alpha proteobacterium AAP81b]